MRVHSNMISRLQRAHEHHRCTVNIQSYCKPCSGCWTCFTRCGSRCARLYSSATSTGPRSAETPVDSLRVSYCLQLSLALLWLLWAASHCRGKRWDSSALSLSLSLSQLAWQTYRSLHYKGRMLNWPHLYRSVWSPSKARPLDWCHWSQR